MSTTSLFTYILHLADTTLLLAQRNAEWTGQGPVLEQDIAITNIALDLLGQSRNLFQHAAALYNGFNQAEKNDVAPLLPRLWQSFHRELNEDDLALLRDEHQYRNVLLAELPKGDWAQTVLRQFFFSAFQQYQYEDLKKCGDAQLAAIAEKSLKEVLYHVRWSSEWVIRLGDGTEESNRRINNAVNELWPFTGELFEPEPFELGALPGGYTMNMDNLKRAWLQKVDAVFDEATLAVPKALGLQRGGKAGRHTEYLGYLLAEMQYLQRVYPNAVW